MAKIVLSKDAPKGQPLSAAFGPSSFDAGSDKSYETDDFNLIEGAESHPFFEVEYDESADVDTVAPDDDADLQAPNFFLDDSVADADTEDND